MTKELKIKIKENWNSCSDTAREIATMLHDLGYLQVPFRRKGWGLAAWLTVDVARLIDIKLKEAKE